MFVCFYLPTYPSIFSWRFQLFIPQSARENIGPKPCVSKELFLRFQFMGSCFFCHKENDETTKSYLLQWGQPICDVRGKICRKTTD